MKPQLKGSWLLFLATLIWGGSFVFQSVGMDYVGAYTFTGIRMVLGGLVLLPVIFFRDRAAKKRGDYQKTDWGKLLLYGAICGFFLCVGSVLQTNGLKYTTTAKSGFLTTFYIIFVALFSLLGKKKPTVHIWIGVLLALSGMYFLCLFGSDFSFNRGDLLTIACALFFTGQIMGIDAFVHKVDPIKFSCAQFLTAGILSLLLMFFFEPPNLGAITQCALPLLYTGVLSCGVAFTLQVVGQQYADPSSTTIIMSFESVFASLAGWIFLSQGLTLPQLIGCAMIFIAVITVQFSNR